MSYHYFCITAIEIFYKDRENKNSLEKAIYYCNEMINIAERVYIDIKEYEKHEFDNAENLGIDWKKELPQERLDATATNSHKGFEQLAIIEFKRKNFQTVINICQKAKDIGWGGDWDRRIEAAKEKMLKNDTKGD